MWMIWLLASTIRRIAIAVMMATASFVMIPIRALSADSNTCVGKTLSPLDPVISATDLDSSPSIRAWRITVDPHDDYPCVIAVSSVVHTDGLDYAQVSVDVRDPSNPNVSLCIHVVDYTPNTHGYVDGVRTRYVARIEVTGSTKTDTITLAGVNDDNDYAIVYDTAPAVDRGVFVSGGNDADSIVGSEFTDSLNGEAGNDLIDGRSGSDTLLGGTGNDTIVGGNETAAMGFQPIGDSIWGGDGNDSIGGGDGMDTICGNDRGSGSVTNDNDSMRGNNDDDLIFGSSPRSHTANTNDNDSIIGDAGYDILYGHEGNDTLVGGTEDDSLYGGFGTDSLHGNSNDDYLLGDSFFTTGDVTLYLDTAVSEPNYQAGGTGGTAGNDTLYGHDGNDYAYGDDGADLIVGGLNDALTADVLSGGFGSDTIWGDDTSAAPDTVTTGFRDVILGSRSDTNNSWNASANSSDHDVLYGTGGDDSIYGQEGNDKIYGGVGNDLLCGGWGADTLWGHAGNESGFYAGLYGEGGIGNTDPLISNGGAGGAAGNDCLLAGDGNDILYGGSGADWLQGGGHADSLIGQGGGDTLNGDSLGDVQGADYLVGGYVGAASINYESGTDLFDARGGNDSINCGNIYDDWDVGYHTGGGADTLYGDTVSGGTEDDIIYGGIGPDSLYGNGGADALYGGPGNDTIYGDVSTQPDQTSPPDTKDWGPQP